MSDLAGTVAENDETVVKTTHIAAAAAFAAAAVGVLPLVGARAADQRNDVSWRVRAIDFRASLDKDGRVQAASFQPAAEQLTRLGVDVNSESLGDIVELRRDLKIIDAAEGGGGFARANILAASQLNSERKCLAEAIYYESRSEGVEGQRAVADVVTNRVKSKNYPDTICGVVYQGSHLKTGCQFSFTCDGSLRHRPRGASWARAEQIAMTVMTGQSQKMMASATHYHTVDVLPVWSASLVKTGQIGAHIFYRNPTVAERKEMAQDAREM